MVHAGTEVGAIIDFRKINSHHNQGKQVPLHCDVNGRDYGYDTGQDVRTHIFAWIVTHIIWISIKSSVY